MINAPASLRSDYYLLCVGIAVCLASDSLSGFVGIRNENAVRGIQNTFKPIPQNNVHCTSQFIGNFVYTNCPALVAKKKRRDHSRRLA